MFAFTSLPALALAVTGAVAVPTPFKATWSEAAHVADLSSIPCLGSDIPADRISTVQAAIVSGNYVLTPDLSLAKCGSEVIFSNIEDAEQTGKEVDVTAIAIGDSHIVGGIKSIDIGLGPVSVLADSRVRIPDALVEGCFSGGRHPLRTRWVPDVLSHWGLRPPGSTTKRLTWVGLDKVFDAVQIEAHRNAVVDAVLQMDSQRPLSMEPVPNFFG
ncbi:hypothetical protein B0H19DRAFT_1321158 [Mycena capillaripes]|nr:hypothetical protein B0H19DRAFT_1321158 [Mycena capillaripes]